jgi:hypothetical protein
MKQISVIFRYVLTAALSFSLTGVPVVHNTANTTITVFAAESFIDTALAVPSEWAHVPLINLNFFPRHRAVEQIAQYRESRTPESRYFRKIGTLAASFLVFLLAKDPGVMVAQSLLAYEATAAEQMTEMQNNFAKHPPRSSSLGKVRQEEFFDRVRSFLERRGVDTKKVSLYAFDDSEKSRYAETRPIYDANGVWQGGVFLGINPDFFEGKLHTVSLTAFFDYLFEHEKRHIDRTGEYLNKRDLLFAIVQAHLLSRGSQINDPVNFKKNLLWRALQSKEYEPDADDAAKQALHAGGHPLTKEIKAVLDDHAKSYPANYQSALSYMEIGVRNEVINLIDLTFTQLTELATRENIAAPPLNGPLNPSIQELPQVPRPSHLLARADEAAALFMDSILVKIKNVADRKSLSEADYECIFTIPFWDISSSKNKGSEAVVYIQQAQLEVNQLLTQAGIDPQKSNFSFRINALYLTLLVRNRLNILPQIRGAREQAIEVADLAIGLAIEGQRQVARALIASGSQPTGARDPNFLFLIPKLQLILELLPPDAKPLRAALDHMITALSSIANSPVKPNDDFIGELNRALQPYDRVVDIGLFRHAPNVYYIMGGLHKVVRRDTASSIPALKNSHRFWVRPLDYANWGPLEGVNSRPVLNGGFIVQGLPDTRAISELVMDSLLQIIQQRLTPKLGSLNGSKSATDAALDAVVSASWLGINPKDIAEMNGFDTDLHEQFHLLFLRIGIPKSVKDIFSPWTTDTNSQLTLADEYGAYVGSLSLAKRPLWMLTQMALAYPNPAEIPDALGIEVKQAIDEVSLLLSGRTFAAATTKETVLLWCASLATIPDIDDKIRVVYKEILIKRFGNILEAERWVPHPPARAVLAAAA